MLPRGASLLEAFCTPEIAQVRRRGRHGDHVRTTTPVLSSFFEPEPCSCAFNGRLTVDACTQLLTTSETAHRSLDLQKKPYSAFQGLATAGVEEPAHGPD